MSSGADRPADRVCHTEPEQRHQRHLADRAGDRDLSDREQVGERKMQAGAEHQQDDADLGQLARQVLVGDVARRERPDEDAGHQVADQRREPNPMGQCPQDECETDFLQRWLRSMECELSRMAFTRSKPTRRSGL